MNRLRSALTFRSPFAFRKTIEQRESFDLDFLAKFSLVIKSLDRGPLLSTNHPLTNTSIKIRETIESSHPANVRLYSPSI